MEKTSSNNFQNIILIIIAIGIWTIVLQNAGFISPTTIEKENVRAVRVVNEIDAKVRGSVDANIYSGSTIDVNLQEINGKRNVFYDDNGNGNYHRLPVSGH